MYESFWILHDKLKKSIKLYGNLVWKRNAPSETGRVGGNYVNPPEPIRKIPFSVTLAYAIQYFEGRSTYDLIEKYSISQTEIFTSI
jgi:hypothetical protein